MTTPHSKQASVATGAQGSRRASDAGDKSRSHRRTSHSDSRTSHTRASAHGSVAISHHDKKDKEKDSHRSSKDSHRSHKESSSIHSTIRPSEHLAPRNDYASYVTNARGGVRTTHNQGTTRHALPSVATKDTRRESTVQKASSRHESKPSRSHSVKESSHRDSRSVKDDSHRDPYDAVRIKSKTAIASDRTSTSTSTIKRSASARTSTRPPQTQEFDDYESLITSKGAKALMTRDSTRKTDHGLESLMTSMASKAVTRRDHSRNTFRTTSSRAPTTKPSDYASTIKPSSHASTIKPTGEVGTYRSSAAHSTTNASAYPGSSAALHGTGISHHGQSGTYTNSGAIVPYDRDSQTLQPSGAGSSAFATSDRGSALALAPVAAQHGHGLAHAHHCAGPYMHCAYPAYPPYPPYPPYGFWGLWGAWGLATSYWKCRSWTEYWSIKSRYIHGAGPPPQPPYPYEEIDVVRATGALAAGKYAANPADALYEAAEERLGWCPCPGC